MSIYRGLVWRDLRRSEAPKSVSRDESSIKSEITNLFIEIRRVCVRHPITRGQSPHTPEFLPFHSLSSAFHPLFQQIFKLPARRCDLRCGVHKSISFFGCPHQAKSTACPHRVNRPASIRRRAPAHIAQPGGDGERGNACARVLLPAESIGALVPAAAKCSVPISTVLVSFLTCALHCSAVISV